MRALVVCFVLVFVFLPEQAEAQRNPYEKYRVKKNSSANRKPWLDPKWHTASAGWYIYPGITYSLTKFKKTE